MPRVVRRLSPALLLVAALALPACGSDSASSSDPSAGRPAPGAPPPLRALQDQRDDLLGGGPDAFRRRLRDLRGHPVVVNQWASWCGPCRFEFPFFQRLAGRYGNRVGFLGVDSNDSRSEAASFLDRFPTPYPHYFDPDADIARVFRGGRAWPTTAFYDASGRLTQTHAGGYSSEARLEEDIRRYALRR
jgi:cytochrome c biogenesis protein CcmG, thiol:disulfide interchange protein DsbE